MASSVPERFSEIKREIAASQPDFQKNATKAWAEILKELEQRTADIVRDGPNVCLLLLASTDPSHIVTSISLRLRLKTWKISSQMNLRKSSARAASLLKILLMMQKPVHGRRPWNNSWKLIQTFTVSIAVFLCSTDYS